MKPIVITNLESVPVLACGVITFHPDNEDDPILLRRALDALTAHRSYDSLTRNGKKLPMDHPIWESLSRAEATWHELLNRFGEKAP